MFSVYSCLVKRQKQTKPALQWVVHVWTWQQALSADTFLLGFLNSRSTSLILPPKLKTSAEKVATACVEEGKALVGLLKESATNPVPVEELGSEKELGSAWDHAVGWQKRSQGMEAYPKKTELALTGRAVF